MTGGVSAFQKTANPGNKGKRPKKRGTEEITTCDQNYPGGTPGRLTNATPTLSDSRQWLVLV